MVENKYFALLAVILVILSGCNIQTTGQATQQEARNALTSLADEIESNPFCMQEPEIQRAIQELRFELAQPEINQNAIIQIIEIILNSNPQCTESLPIPFMTNVVNGEYTITTNTQNVEDVDFDGLSQEIEFAIGTDPNNPDTDGDGIPDGVEYQQGSDPLIDELSIEMASDNDQDGLTFQQEQSIGTDPNNPDTDGDNLDDFTEVDLGTNPLDIDTDQDGVPDGVEVDLGSDPLFANIPEPIDEDGDGLFEDDELYYGTDPLNPDSDSDGLTDGDEVNQFTTNPLNPDSDGDGIIDGTEVQQGTNPLQFNIIDTDQDGLSDEEEIQIGTDINNPDTDFDGLTDFEEVNFVTDPLDPDSDNDGLLDGQDPNPEDAQCTLYGCLNGEVCNGENCVPVDDPCLSCTDTQQCINGNCVENCDLCSDNQVCQDNNCVDIDLCNPNPCDQLTETCNEGNCIPNDDPCALCTENQVCQGESCVDIDPCDDVICQEWQSCIDGTCTPEIEPDPCDGVVCQDGDSCIQGTCRGPCFNVQCGLNEECISGNCHPIDLCLGVTCGNFEECSQGICNSYSPCRDVTCDINFECNENTGTCNPVDICNGVDCPLDFTCNQGTCEKDFPCAGVICSTGYSCQDGNCNPDDACAIVSCPDNHECTSGVCTEIDRCLNIQCPSGESCDNGNCIPDYINPCAGITCSNEYETCQQGNCIDTRPDCSQIQCQTGYTCDQNQRSCVLTDACLITQCPNGETCNDGNCIPTDICSNIDCPTGFSCNPLTSSCISNNPCDAVTCSGNTICQEGICITPNACAGVVCDNGFCVNGQCRTNTVTTTTTTQTKNKDYSIDPIYINQIRDKIENEIPNLDKNAEISITNNEVKVTLRGEEITLSNNVQNDVLDIMDKVVDQQIYNPSLFELITEFIVNLLTNPIQTITNDIDFDTTGPIVKASWGCSDPSDPINPICTETCFDMSFGAGICQYSEEEETVFSDGSQDSLGNFLPAAEGASGNWLVNTVAICECVPFDISTPVPPVEIEYGKCTKESENYEAEKSLDYEESHDDQISLGKGSKTDEEWLIFFQEMLGDAEPNADGECTGGLYGEADEKATELKSLTGWGDEDSKDAAKKEYDKAKEKLDEVNSPNSGATDEEKAQAKEAFQEAKDNLRIHGGESAVLYQEAIEAGVEDPDQKPTPIKDTSLSETDIKNLEQEAVTAQQNYQEVIDRTAGPLNDAKAKVKQAREKVASHFVRGSGNYIVDEDYEVVQLDENYEPEPGENDPLVKNGHEDELKEDKEELKEAQEELKEIEDEKKEAAKKASETSAAADKAKKGSTNREEIDKWNAHVRYRNSLAHASITQQELNELNGRISDMDVDGDCKVDKSYIRSLNSAGSNSEHTDAAYWAAEYGGSADDYRSNTDIDGWYNADEVRTDEEGNPIEKTDSQTGETEMRYVTDHNGDPVDKDNDGEPDQVPVYETGVHHDWDEKQHDTNGDGKVDKEETEAAKNKAIEKAVKNMIAATYITAEEALGDGSDCTEAAYGEVDTPSCSAGLTTDCITPSKGYVGGVLKTCSSCGVGPITTSATHQPPSVTITISPEQLESYKSQKKKGATATISYTIAYTQTCTISIDAKPACGNPKGTLPEDPPESEPAQPDSKKPGGTPSGNSGGGGGGGTGAPTPTLEQEEQTPNQPTEDGENTGVCSEERQNERTAAINEGKAGIGERMVQISCNTLDFLSTSDSTDFETCAEDEVRNEYGVCVVEEAEGDGVPEDDPSEVPDRDEDGDGILDGTDSVAPLIEELVEVVVLSSEEAPIEESKTEAIICQAPQVNTGTKTSEANFRLFAIAKAKQALQSGFYNYELQSDGTYSMDSQESEGDGDETPEDRKKEHISRINNHWKALKKLVSCTSTCENGQPCDLTLENYNEYYYTTSQLWPNLQCTCGKESALPTLTIPTHVTYPSTCKPATNQFEAEKELGKLRDHYLKQFYEWKDDNPDKKYKGLKYLSQEIQQYLEDLVVGAHVEGNKIRSRDSQTVVEINCLGQCYSGGAPGSTGAVKSCTPKVEINQITASDEQGRRKTFFRPEVKCSCSGPTVETYTVPEEPNTVVGPKVPIEDPNCEKGVENEIKNLKKTIDNERHNIEKIRKSEKSTRKEYEEANVKIQAFNKLVERLKTLLEKCKPNYGQDVRDIIPELEKLGIPLDVPICDKGVREQIRSFVGEINELRSKVDSLRNKDLTIEQANNGNELIKQIGELVKKLNILKAKCSGTSAQEITDFIEALQPTLKDFEVPECNPDTRTKIAQKRQEIDAKIAEIESLRNKDLTIAQANNGNEKIAEVNDLIKELKELQKLCSGTSAQEITIYIEALNPKLDPFVPPDCDPKTRKQLDDYDKQIKALKIEIDSLRNKDLTIEQANKGNEKIAELKILISKLTKLKSECSDTLAQNIQIYIEALEPTLTPLKPSECNPDTRKLIKDTKEDIDKLKTQIDALRNKDLTIEQANNGNELIKQIGELVKKLNILKAKCSGTSAQEITDFIEALQPTLKDFEVPECNPETRTKIAEKRKEIDAKIAEIDILKVKKENNQLTIEEANTGNKIISEINQLIDQLKELQKLCSGTSAQEITIYIEALNPKLDPFVPPDCDPNTRKQYDDYNKQIKALKAEIDALRDKELSKTLTKEEAKIGNEKIAELKILISKLTDLKSECSDTLAQNIQIYIEALQPTLKDFDSPECNPETRKLIADHKTDIDKLKVEIDSFKEKESSKTLTIEEAEKGNDLIKEVKDLITKLNILKAKCSGTSAQEITDFIETLQPTLKDFKPPECNPDTRTKIAQKRNEIDAKIAEIDILKAKEKNNQLTIAEANTGNEKITEINELIKELKELQKLCSGTSAQEITIYIEALNPKLDPFVPPDCDPNTRNQLNDLDQQIVALKAEINALRNKESSKTLTKEEAKIGNEKIAELKILISKLTKLKSECSDTLAQNIQIYIEALQPTLVPFVPPECNPDTRKLINEVTQFLESKKIELDKLDPSKLSKQEIIAANKEIDIFNSKIKDLEKLLKECNPTYASQFKFEEYSKFTVPEGLPQNQNPPKDDLPACTEAKVTNGVCQGICSDTDAGPNCRPKSYSVCSWGHGLSEQELNEAGYDYEIMLDENGNQVLDSKGKPIKRKLDRDGVGNLHIAEFTYVDSDGNELSRDDLVEMLRSRCEALSKKEALSVIKNLWGTKKDKAQKYAHFGKQADNELHLKEGYCERGTVLANEGGSCFCGEPHTLVPQPPGRIMTSNSGKIYDKLKNCGSLSTPENEEGKKILEDAIEYAEEAKKIPLKEELKDRYAEARKLKCPTRDEIKKLYDESKNEKKWDKELDKIIKLLKRYLKNGNIDTQAAQNALDSLRLKYGFKEMIANVDEMLKRCKETDTVADEDIGTKLPPVDPSTSTPPTTAECGNKAGFEPQKVLFFREILKNPLYRWGIAKSKWKKGAEAVGLDLLTGKLRQLQNLQGFCGGDCPEGLVCASDGEFAECDCRVDIDINQIPFLDDLKPCPRIEKDNPLKDLLDKIKELGKQIQKEESAFIKHMKNDAILPKNPKLAQSIKDKKEELRNDIDKLKEAFEKNEFDGIPVCATPTLSSCSEDSCKLYYDNGKFKCGCGSDTESNSEQFIKELNDLRAEYATPIVVPNYCADLSNDDVSGSAINKVLYEVRSLEESIKNELKNELTSVEQVRRINLLKANLRSKSDDLLKMHNSKQVNGVDICPSTQPSICGPKGCVLIYVDVTGSYDEKTKTYTEGRGYYKCGCTTYAHTTGNDPTKYIEELKNNKHIYADTDIPGCTASDVITRNVGPVEGEKTDRFSGLSGEYSSNPRAFQTRFTSLCENAKKEAESKCENTLSTSLTSRATQKECNDWCMDQPFCNSGSLSGRPSSSCTAQGGCTWWQPHCGRGKHPNKFLVDSNNIKLKLKTPINLYGEVWKHALIPKCPVGFWVTQQGSSYQNGAQDKMKAFGTASGSGSISCVCS